MELSRLEADLKAALQLMIGHKEAVGALLGRAAQHVRHVKAELAQGPAAQQAQQLQALRGAAARA